MRKRKYTSDQIRGLLRKAKAIGFSLKRGCQLERLTLHELDVLVNIRP